VPPIPGVSRGHHDLSPTPARPDKITQLRTIGWKDEGLPGPVVKLRDTTGKGPALLDPDTVFFSATWEMPATLDAGTCRSSGRRVPARPATMAFDPNSTPPVQPLREHAAGAGARGETGRFQHGDAHGLEPAVEGTISAVVSRRASEGFGASALERTG